MSTHMINLAWKRTSKDFHPENYNRAHTVLFSGGSSLLMTAAPEFSGEPGITNPEELLIASISSCFMLTFLSIASSKGIVVESYVDQATGLRDKNAHGKTVITEVTLRPHIAFAKGSSPEMVIVTRLLEKTQSNCFITNSIKTVVNVEPEIVVAV